MEPDDYADSLTTIKAIQDINKLTLIPNRPAALLTAKAANWVASWKTLE